MGSLHSFSSVCRFRKRRGGVSFSRALFCMSPYVLIVFWPWRSTLNEKAYFYAFSCVFFKLNCCICNMYITCESLWSLFFPLPFWIPLPVFWNIIMLLHIVSLTLLFSHVMIFFPSLFKSFFNVRATSYLLPVSLNDLEKCDKEIITSNYFD